MRSYIIKRVLLVIPTLLCVTLLVFTLIRLLPGDVVDLMLQTSVQDGSDSALRAILGQQQPLLLQYLGWLGRVLQGDLGTSLWTKNAVCDDILYRLPVTLEVGGLALLVAVALALPIGIVSATRQETWQDYLARSLAIGGLAIPGFWLATMVVVLPAYYWGWTPSIQFIKLRDDVWGHLLQLLLPACILGFASAAGLMRLTRAMMLEVLRQDYIRTARAKGLYASGVVLKHALRNAMLPVLTAFGVQLAQLAGGTVIMESIFNLPGMGKFLLEAIAMRDYPVVQGVNLLLATIVVLLNLGIDLLYALIDPRIRYQ